MKAEELRKSGFEVPNLDGLSTDPAELLGAAVVLETLSAYARHKARAMQARFKGDVTEALAYEAWCEALYSGLPEWARW